MGLSRALTVTWPAVITALVLLSASATPSVVAEGEGIRLESRRVSFLGVRVAEVDLTTTHRLKLPEERGVLVLAVESGSPAKAAGLRAEDVLWTFRHEPLHSVPQLRRLVRETPPGRHISLGFYRDGGLQRTQIAMAENSQHEEFHLELPDFHLRFPRDLFELERFTRIGRPRLGVSVTPLTDQLADHLGAAGGLLVTAVEDTSPADKAGIRAGDVIQRVDQRSVNSVSDLRNALEDKSDVSVELVRDHKTRVLTVQLAASRRSGSVI